MRTLALGAFLAVAALPLLGCSKPQPPQITVIDAKVTGIDLAGLTVDVHAEAVNPNKFPLMLQSVTGSATLDGKYELGAVTVTKPVTLPAGERTAISAPLTMKWQNVTTLASLVAGAESIPFTVKGDAAIGGEKLQVSVPFQVQGTLTRAQITQSALRSIPTLPGFPPAP
ncbi:LEA type 2 family protein [Pendulispora albinea]|uniref:LEA type 2 family protein n=1 Tax=Pendulispora albinea TaxID=2741071 RepID=A0ABZ2LMG0_9BACT